MTQVKYIQILSKSQHQKSTRQYFWQNNTKNKQKNPEDPRWLYLLKSPDLQISIGLEWVCDCCTTPTAISCQEQVNFYIPKGSIEII